MRIAKNYIGDKYGRLTLLSELPRRNKDRVFACLCACGRRVSVVLNNARSGNTRSCGCLRAEANSRPEVRQKISDSHNKRVAEGKNNQWKGESASYEAKHMYIHNHFGKAVHCENPKCKYPRYNSHGVYLEKPKRFEWANLTGKFRDVHDYKQLCPSCHRKFDLGLLTI